MAIQQIQPQTNFPIARLLPDLGDGVTYYLQAIVRNATTNATIATVNLPSLGSRIFGATWRVVADPSGQGLYITITISVYTDSGRTTKSQNYSDESDTFIVYDQYHQLQFLATQLSALLGADSAVDYKKIKKIVQDVVDPIPGMIDIPPPIPPIDYTPSLVRLTEDIKQAIADKEVTKVPEYQKTDLTPVIDEIHALEIKTNKRFDGIKDPTPPTDIKPILDRLEGINFTDVVAKFTTLLATLEKTSGNIEEKVPELGKHITEFVSQSREFIKAMVMNETARQDDQARQQKEAMKRIDVSVTRKGLIRDI